MGRWEPGASARLAEAALELYAERGFELTTVADIAARAGVTERTFFRYFSDKREALFSGSESFQALFLDAIDTAPADLPPMAVMELALAACASFFKGRIDHSRQRAIVINANEDLMERELMKLARLTAAIAERLRARGVKEPAASLAAETCLSVFNVAFTRWVAPGNRRGFAALLDQSFSELRAITAA